MAAEKFAQYLQGEVPYPLMHILIQNMRAGQRISQCFLVKQKTQRATRTGDPYLEIVLADRSGTVPARAWAEATQRYASEFEEGDFVFVEGRTETYRHALQIIVESIRRLETYEREAGKVPEFDPGLLVPTSEHDIDEMWKELQGLIATLEPAPLQQLTLGILTDHEQEFKEFPAAAQYHHAYLGGLLEHTLEVANGVFRYSEDQPTLDRSLATAGAILHDIGKIKELANPVAPYYSLNGQLIGHLLLGRDMVRDAARGITWPDDRLPRLLEHIIISHHGELEFGAAIVPKTAEAITVYYFDNLSAKLNMVRMHIAKDSEPGEFTDWHKLLARKFFKGKLSALS
jgi:3'-5' exoribonuclease